MDGTTKKTRKTRSDKGGTHVKHADSLESRRSPFAGKQRRHLTESERTVADNAIEREARVLAFTRRAERAGKSERTPIASPLEAHEVERFRSDACDTVYARMLSYAHRPRSDVKGNSLLKLIDSYGAFLRAVDLPTTFRLHDVHEAFVARSPNGSEVLHFLQTVIDSGYITRAACGLCWEIDRGVLFAGQVRGVN